MKYKVEYTPQVFKTLEKLDKFTKRIIIEWIEKNLVDSGNPRANGKLTNSDCWTYHIGVYRLLAIIRDDTLIILHLASSHRMGGYEK